MPLSDKEHIELINYVLKLNKFTLDELVIIDNDFNNNQETTDIVLYIYDYHISMIPFIIIVHALSLVIYGQIKIPKQVKFDKFIISLINSVILYIDLDTVEKGILTDILIGLIDVDISVKYTKYKAIDKELTRNSNLYNIFPQDNYFNKINMLLVLLITFTRTIVNSMSYANINNNTDMIIDNNNLMIRLFSGINAIQNHNKTISEALVISIAEGLIIPIPDAIYDENYMTNVIYASIEKTYTFIDLITKQLDHENAKVIISKTKLIEEIYQYTS